MFIRTCLSAFCFVSITASAFAADFEHGDALVLSPEEFQAHTKAGLPTVGIASATYSNGQVSAFSVDTSDRTDVVSFYHCIYQASEGFETRMNWVGNIPSCNEGTVSSAFHDDTLRRINYYRAMVGLNADVYFDATKNAKCQKAALIMARNNLLSHFPTNSLPCWTADGYEAAGKSNLSRGSGQDYTGPRAVDGQIRDDGANNVLVGHRRWLVYPPAQEMGNGGIPWVSGYSSAASVWVIGNFGARPPSPTWVGWPNPGFVPYDLVPARWSLSMHNADFDHATVSMTHNGSPVSLTKIHPTVSSPAAGVGDPAIVWEPAGIPGSAPLADETYTVTVSGIVGGVSNEVTYSVTLIDPYSLGQDMVIDGPEYPHAFADNVYTFPAFTGADSYHVRMRKFAASTWLEGAEVAPAPQIVDETDPGYPLIQSSLVRTGSRAFQMSFPTFQDQAFEVDRDIVPSATSELHFAFRRRWSHEFNEIIAQVSTNNGSTWSAVWVENGVCLDGMSCSSGSWDASWITANPSLSAFAGQPIRLRFAFKHNGSAFIGTGSDYGVFIDDITVTDAIEDVGVTEVDLPGTATDFTLQPDGAYTYIMDMYVDLDCHTFGYGPPTTVQAVPGLWVSRIEEAGGQMTVGFDVTGGTYSTHSLESMANPVGSWTEDTGAVYNGPLKEFTTPSAGPTLYRVTGDR